MASGGLAGIGAVGLVATAGAGLPSGVLKDFGGGLFGFKLTFN